MAWRRWIGVVGLVAGCTPSPPLVAVHDAPAVPRDAPLPVVCVEETTAQQLEDALGYYTEVMLEREVDCFGRRVTTEADIPPRRYRPRRLAAWRRGIARGDLAIDWNRLQRCVELAAATCDYVPDCNEWVMARCSSNGLPCGSDTDCAPDEVCDLPADLYEGGCARPGRCQRASTAGEYCNEHADCRGLAYCTGGRCDAHPSVLGTLDEPCGEVPGVLRLCPRPYECNIRTDGCQRATEPDTCRFTDDCIYVVGAVCVDGRCLVPGELDQPCTRGCEVGLACESGTCRATRGDRGDRCDTDSDCREAFRCEGGLCTSLIGEGSTCETDGDCGSACCLADACTP